MGRCLPVGIRYCAACLVNYCSCLADLGKMLVVIGAVIVAVGLVLWTGIGRGWLGRLPGDINVTRSNFSFHFPLVTCIVISAVLTLLMWLFRR